ncbi:Ribosomal RNA large subunit methyltransferase A [hydrothermal vent metagenome]|uniref:Ribosomal RNA large subunit methyltransferase A n=1 Tax=hydrothermal vent metagenome TaxID=652676 RepID=A0A3B0ZTP2_9ZZZZ
MSLSKLHNLACPLDGEALLLNERQLICKNGHSFDVARQGYVNLLPVQQKRSKDPGDSKEMVLARSQFLNTGVYAPIANKLAETVNELTGETGEDSERSLLDAGCGEGYYTDVVYRYLQKQNPGKLFSVVGLDISKPAVHEAAKRNKDIAWIVGTNRQPPLLENSVDIILCVFGFQSFEGFQKILKTGGKIILIEPGPDHLTELREIIYTEVKKTEPMDLSHLEETRLVLEDIQHLKFSTGLIKKESIKDLLLMTPHFFRANNEGRETALNLAEINLSVDVVIRVLQKNNP